MELPQIPETMVACEHLVGGQWCSPPDAERRDLLSPYNGRMIGRVPLGSSRETAAIVARAGEAAARWRRVPMKERCELLFRFRERVLVNIDRLANGAALESGKTVAEARAGILKGVEVIEFALSLQNLDRGGASEVSRGVSCEARREPLGVVAGITPFNFPAMVPLWMMPIAIAVGNAFVLKPSEKVPTTACLLGALLQEAGAPPGVFSILHGGREAAEALLDHPDVAALGFVGSSAAARAVYARAAQAGKRVLALGGAKNSLLVMPDADPEITVPGIVSSFTGCAGQRCMAASLLLAVGEADHLLDAVIERAGQLQLGRDMGAIIDRAALQRLERAIDRARQDGAVLRLDGRRPAAPAGCEQGNWLAPTVLDRADPSWPCATEELFGPVLTIVRVATLDEALSIERNSRYGNATSVFTRRGDIARYVADRATAGMIGVNVGVPVPREPFSFGGTKQSRFGQGDITGDGGVALWSQLKKVTSKWAIQGDGTWMS